MDFNEISANCGGLILAYEEADKGWFEMTHPIFGTHSVLYLADRSHPLKRFLKKMPPGEGDTEFVPYESFLHLAMDGWRVV